MAFSFLSDFQVLAQASIPTRFVSADAAVDALVEATVSAFATAESSACGTGVFSADTFVSILAEAIAAPYIEVFAMALALATPGAETSLVVVDVEADVFQVTTVEGFTASDVVGNGSYNSSSTISLNLVFRVANANSDGDAGADVAISG